MESLKRKVEKKKTKDDEWRNGNCKGKQEGRNEETKRKEERIAGKKRIKRIKDRK